MTTNTIEDILNLIYSIHKEMPNKSFIDIISYVYPLSTYENNAQTYELFKKFMDDNDIEHVESPSEILSFVVDSIKSDLSIIESNLLYCIRDGRYLEAEKEITAHETLSEYLHLIVDNPSSNQEPDDKNNNCR